MFIFIVISSIKRVNRQQCIFKMRGKNIFLMSMVTNYCIILFRCVFLQFFNYVFAVCSIYPFHWHSPKQKPITAFHSLKMDMIEMHSIYYKNNLNTRIPPHQHPKPKSNQSYFSLSTPYTFRYQKALTHDNLWL